MAKGLLIINLGTPRSPHPFEVARFLFQFLCDKRVISLPRILRYLLFWGIILPFRLYKTTQAYQRIWTEHGSPLLFHSNELIKALRHKLQKTHEVHLAMRYGKPSLKEALASLAHCETLTILPLYPQYASASTGSSLEATLTYLSRQTNIPSLDVIHEFYDHPSFIHAQAEQIKPYLKDHEFILFSYHGLPEKQVLSSGCNAICKHDCPDLPKTKCYRAKCYRTTTLIAQSLHLTPTQFTTSFQSRLGRLPWIQPYTETYFISLIQQGIKRLLIVCPSFTMDCLETLDEINHAARKKWLQLGGEKLTLVPSLNSSAQWIEAIIHIIQKRGILFALVPT